MTVSMAHPNSVKNIMEVKFIFFENLKKLVFEYIMYDAGDPI